MRRSLLLLACLSIGSMPAWAYAQPADEPASAIEGDEDSAYQRHMKNGVKLFREQNWDGAIAEFDAAYRAEPKASPLINLALTHKRLNDPAKAIEVLERALRDHRDSMPPDQLAAAEKEVGEMRALLAFVKIEVAPPTARVFVDDRPVPVEHLREPLALSPGTRVVRVEADGYEPAEHKILIASGHENPALAVALEPTLGSLVVVPEDEEAVVEVDGRQVGQGRWEGSLRPGLHVVRILVDDEAKRLDVMVQAGEAHRVEQIDGELSSEAAVPANADDQDRPGFGPPQLALLRGVYFNGSGAVLTAAILNTGGNSTFQVEGSNRFGGAGALHLGYRVADWAGFEAFGQYSDVRTEGLVKGDVSVSDGMGTTTTVAVSTPATMVLSSVRFGGLMRLLVPGRGMFRFVGRVGGGAVFDRLRFDLADAAQPVPEAFRLGGDFREEGFGFFAKVDFGAELEVDNLIFDLMVEHAFQTTKHFDTEAGLNPFNTDPMVVAGLSLGVGYGIW